MRRCIYGFECIIILVRAHVPGRKMHFFLGTGSEKLELRSL